MEKNHSDCETGNPLPPLDVLLFPISSKGSFICTHRQNSTYYGLCSTSCGALAGTQNSSVAPPEGIDLITYHTISRLYQWASGAGRSSEVERSLMVRWVVGSILHEVDPLSYFSFQPVLHDWYTKGRGMCYPVCGMVHIKEPLLLIGKSSLCGGSGFPLSLSEWSLTICLTPYNRR